MKRYAVFTIIVVLIAATITTYAIRNQQPVPLVFVDIPAEDAASTAEHWQPLMDYLAEYLGRPVELRVVTDYTAVVAALRYGHADIARLGSSSYVLAEKEIDLIPIASIANDDGSLMAYRSYIIIRSDSGITNLSGVSFAFVDIGSTSGYLLPATYLKKQGIGLGEIVFAGSHPAVIESVKNGSVDAGAIASMRWMLAVQEGVIKPDELHILWQSDPIPRGPTVVRADMPKELREAIQEALLNAPPDLVAQCNLGSNRFGPAPPDTYDSIREIQKYIGLMSD